MLVFQQYSKNAYSRYWFPDNTICTKSNIASLIYSNSSNVQTTLYTILNSSNEKLVEIIKLFERNSSEKVEGHRHVTDLTYSWLRCKPAKHLFIAMLACTWSKRLINVRSAGSMEEVGHHVFFSILRKEQLDVASTISRLKGQSKRTSSTLLCTKKSAKVVTTYERPLNALCSQHCVKVRSYFMFLRTLNEKLQPVF